MFQLALRNLLRHRGRTSIALLAIGFGVVALMLAGGFIEWVFWGMREGAIQSRIGHIQVASEGYFAAGKSDPFNYFLPAQVDAAALEASSQHIKAVTPRLDFTGLISHGDVTVGFIGEGVDPVKEQGVSRHLVIAAGAALSSDAPEGILLGKGLAANLGVGVGDRVVLLANTGTGSMNGLEADVRGLFSSTAKAFDDTALRVPLEMAHKLLRASGAHTLVVLLDDTDFTDQTVHELRTYSSTAGLPLEIRPWYTLAEFYNKTVALFSRQMHLVRLVIAVIIVLSISNTMMMSVLERTREIGTLMAIGQRRRMILRLFVAEGLLLGILGGSIGGGVGYLLAALISHVGIPMPPPPGMDIGYTARIRLTWELSFGTVGLAIVTTLLASLYPAWRASRLVIVDALRHNR